ncbi:MAG: hypothetical protein Q9200_004122 [Gallowayella weberi]
MSLDIVDSHIHLYPGSEVQSLAWYTEGHPLQGQHSVQDYLEATKELPKVSAQKLQGFIFIETDRKSHLRTEAGWEEPLRELDWIKRVTDGRPRTGEGHEPQHSQLCLGIVLWAPVPSGAEAMQRYTAKVRERAGSTWPLVKGFRYLVQDKPPGTMLSAAFIESLKWMGRNGFAFDLGVDARSAGLWQLSEALEMIEEAHKGVSENQRPDMRSRNQDGNPATEPFMKWKELMVRLASLPNVYMKLSGGFSEMNALPHQTEQGDWGFAARDELVQKTQDWAGRWLRETVAAFAPQSILYGSDWPVCNVGGGGNQVSWLNWWSVVGNFVQENLSKEDQAGFWSGNALRAYGVI